MLFLGKPTEFWAQPYQPAYEEPKRKPLNEVQKPRERVPSMASYIDDVFETVRAYKILKHLEIEI